MYAYIIKEKQNFYPKCFIQNIKGNKFEVEIKEEFVSGIYYRAIEFKAKTNKCIHDGDIDKLANPSTENCSYCDYRPICNQYKIKFINNFENKIVDICGEVVEIKGVEKLEIKIKLENKTLILKGISTIEKISIRDTIFVYNLFCPDGQSQILFAMKQTLIKHG